MSLIMECVTTVTYHVRVNGSYTDIIIPNSLRQRDPLSPYLYLICGKALTRCLEAQGRMGKILFPKLTTRGDRVGDAVHKSKRGPGPT